MERDDWKETSSPGEFLRDFGRGGVPDDALPLHRRAAILTGHLLHPALVGIPVSILTAIRFQGSITPRFAAAGAVALATCIVFPLAWIYLLNRFGELTDGDIHLRQRRNRLVFYPVALMAVAATWSMFRWLLPFAVAEAMAAASIAVVAALWASTYVLKTSLHCAGDTAIVTGVLLVYGPQWAPLYAIPALVTWARVTAGRHTLAETLTGHAAGFLPTLLVVRLLYPEAIAPSW